MSVDESVTTDLIQTLQDGQEGYTAAAEKLSTGDHAQWSPRLQELALQRATFAAELTTMAAAYGDAITEDGTVAGTLHRGWMALKDALSGSDSSAVLDAAEQGEDHAVGVYRKALDQELSTDLRAVVERQFTEVRAAHDEVRAMRNGVR